VAGGFNADCGTCAAPTQSRWSIARASQTLVQRPLPVLGPSGGPVETGIAVSEVLVMPDVCGPCVLTLRFVVLSGAGAAERIDVTGIRLGLVDLGPV
jgi:hypothetical protein